MTGVELIATERARQQRRVEEGGEGWDAAHDRGHSHELAMAGACYALKDPRIFDAGIGSARVNVNLWRALWPWEQRWWKPVPDDRVRELTKAGALIAAAIDSLLEERR